MIEARMNQKDATISTAAYAIVILLLGSLSTSYAASNTLPVLLVHGYFEDASVWFTWETLLRQDGIPFHTVTFSNDDKCGSANDHASELRNMIQNIIRSNGSQKVNIVGHSKGGLDARTYLATGTHNVANLIMIGTPNRGSPLALYSNECSPAIWDLRPGSKVLSAPRNPNTMYYTISGDWLPNLWGFGNGGNYYIAGPDDGLVAVSSVESKNYFKSLGQTWHNHGDLLGQQEYSLVRDVLIGMK